MILENYTDKFLTIKRQLLLLIKLFHLNYCKILYFIFFNFPHIIAQKIFFFL